MQFPARWLLALLPVGATWAHPPSYPEVLWDDTRYVLSAPARWEGEEWEQMGLASLAVLGTALVIDGPVRDTMQRQQGDNPTITQLERFGSEYALATIGGFYALGALTDNDRAAQVAKDSIAASLVASAIITPTIKFLAGRSRPRDNRGLYHFKPFSNLNASFPSGHTTEAFALAAVIAEHYEETWVSITTYAIASTVGLARTYHRAHFASDVLAGAMIGALTGKAIVNHNRSPKQERIVLLPEAGDGSIGLTLKGSF